MKILVVDDSKVNRLYIKSILESHQHEIFMATNGIEALVQIGKMMPDVILLDLMMPELDGYETCRYIMNNPDTNHIPVIIMTAIGTIDSLVKAFDVGAMDFIKKPPNELELVARVHSAIRIKQYRDSLKDMIIKDGLTGLYTHSYFISTMEREFYTSRRYQGKLGIAILDIDDFKRVNDTYGHLAGDNVLRVISNILVDVVRISDVVARYGGEEFAIIASHSNLDGTYEMSERIRKRIESTSVTEKEHTISITISAGVTHINSADVDYNETIKRADGALYEAKKAGKNRVVVRA